MAQEWTRIEGMIIGHELDPSTVAAELKERAILAQLEWSPSSPELLGLNVAVCDDRVATVPADSTEVTPGPTPGQLAEELAILFDAEVRIGNATSDQLPDGESPLGRVWPSDEDAPESAETAPTRIVEIGRTPASSVPLLAALEGVDLGDLELADGHRALLAELPPEKEGWNFGDLPLVTLSMSDGEFQVFLVTDDHLENIVSHNWGMDAAIVPGGHDGRGIRVEGCSCPRPSRIRRRIPPGNHGRRGRRRGERPPGARHLQRHRTKRGHHDGAAAVGRQAPVELLRVGGR